MKKGSTLFLKGVISALGIAAIALAYFAFPVAVSAKAGYSPILLGMYVTLIPFFLALYQTLRLLNLIDKNKAFSDLSVKALKTIKYCGIAISVWYAAWMPYIFMVADADDAPGVVLIGLFFIFVSAIAATFAAVLQKLMQNGLDIKSENDLTV